LSQNNHIDLILFNSQDTSVWEAGNVFTVPFSAEDVQAQIKNIVGQSASEWILFWDSALGEPHRLLIQQLIEKPVDAWHAGLKLGSGELPDCMNHVHPTWMYNKNAASTVEHTSFRLNLRACLIKTSLLKAIKLPEGKYSSMEMYGTALGYSILKQGGIIRYHPDLVKTGEIVTSVPQIDEWVFAREFFTRKWQLWILLNKAGFLNSLSSWLKTSDTKHKELEPIVHRSDVVLNLNGQPSVSVMAPTLDRYSYLQSELEQLSEQTILPYEVLITDQTDKDKRAAPDHSKYPALTIRYFPQDEKGQSIAWNKMLEEAAGDYVLFLGDDADDIKPDFIQRLLHTMQRFDCDMVSSNVIENGIAPKHSNHISISDTFPICLVKKQLVIKSGFMDMFFNKTIRADQDLAMRCHLNGALMVYDPSATIFHHRAPVGGLRAHNARTVTNYMIKQSVTKFLNPTSSEIYIALKYFSSQQASNYIKIKYLNQLFIKGNFMKKLARCIFFLVKLPSLRTQYYTNKKNAMAALNKQSTVATAESLHESLAGN
jgi:glycosyltransferase involved in cell wall biosynthesis